MATAHELDLLAEFAAQGQAIVKILSGLAALTALQTGDKGVYLAKILESGLRDIEKTDYWSVPPDQKEGFLENAKARYTTLVTSAGGEGTRPSS